DVADKICPHLEVVFVDNPGQGVAEGGQVLAGLAIGVAICVTAKSYEIGPEIDEGIAMCRKLLGSHNGPIRVDCVLVKADARKEALERRVALGEAVFAIDAATGLIDERTAEHVDVRKRQRIVANVALLQA